MAAPPRRDGGVWPRPGSDGLRQTNFKRKLRRHHRHHFPMLLMIGTVASLVLRAPLSPRAQPIVASAVDANIEPLDIVRHQLSALQRGGDEDLAAFMQYCDPMGELCAAHDSSASDGPLALFKAKIRREPRWRRIGQRPLAALLHHKSADIIKGANKGYSDDSTFRVRVRVQPHFPDAPEAESEVLFDWLLRRSLVGSLSAPKTIWRVDQVSADFSGWSVSTGTPSTAAEVRDEDAARAAWLAENSRFDA